MYLMFKFKYVEFNCHCNRELVAVVVPLFALQSELEKDKDHRIKLINEDCQCDCLLT